MIIHFIKTTIENKYLRGKLTDDKIQKSIIPCQYEMVIAKYIRGRFEYAHENFDKGYFVVLGTLFRKKSKQASKIKHLF